MTLLAPHPAPPLRRLRHLLLLPALAALLALAGCDTVIGIPPGPAPDSPPEPRTPVAAVDRLIWSWTRRAKPELEQLFAGNFRFAYPAGDTLRATAHQGEMLGASDTLEWFREEELAISERLFFRGSSTHRPALSISIVLDSVIFDVPDPRPGRSPRWHRAIRVRSVAGIRLDTGYLRVDDSSTFYVVRGDSAQIPFELLAKGVRPDSTWWWIERWEEGPPASSGGAAFLDYARLKLMYRSP